MKKLIFVFACFVLLSSGLHAQGGNILIVPFGDRMFYNEAAADMLKVSGLSYSEMVKEFENGLVAAIQSEGGRRFISPAGVTTTSQDVDVKMRVRSLLDFYGEKISSKSTAKKAKLFAKSSSKLENKNPRGEKQGEVVSIIGSPGNQFISSKVNSKREFSKLCKELGVSKVLVINEMDIKEDFSSPYNNGTEHLRQIQIHYSLFDNRGKKLSTGIILKNFSSSENNVREIIRLYFKDLAKDLISKLP